MPSLDRALAEFWIVILAFANVSFGHAGRIAHQVASNYGVDARMLILSFMEIRD